MFQKRLRELFKNTQFRLICIIILILFVPGIVVLKMGFDKSEKIMLQKTSRLISENLQNKENRIVEMMYATRKLSSITSTNKDITQILLGLSKNPHSKNRSINSYTLSDWDNVNFLQNILDNYRNTFFDYQVHNILIGMDGTTFSVLDGINDSIRFRSNFVSTLNKQQWYNEFLDSKSDSTWVAPCSYNSAGNFSDGIFYPDAKNYVVFARKIHDYITQEDLGISVISLHAENIQNILNADKDCVMALVNNEGQLIASTDSINSGSPKSLITSELCSQLPDNKSGYINTKIGNSKYMINYLEMDTVGWKLVYALPDYMVTPEITELRNYTYSISVTIYVMALILCIVLIVFITNPLKRVIERVKRIRIGEQLVGQDGAMTGDLRNVESTFDYMFNRIEDLVNTVLKKQQLESQLKYETLRAQINPHFLFNTLNSIKWSAMISGAGNIADMISCLGELLEASTQRGEEMIPLKREVELVKSYAKIKSWTTKYRFKLEFDIEEELSEFKIFKFCLQPIVENAVIHGIEDLEDGLITIKAFRKDSDVVISVRDNGQGMDREKIDEILAFKEDSSTPRKKFSGIGLSSIDGVIRIKYGPQYGINIESEKSRGTTITILLPYLK